MKSWRTKVEGVKGPKRRTLLIGDKRQAASAEEHFDTHSASIFSVPGREHWDYLLVTVSQTNGSETMTISVEPGDKYVGLKEGRLEFRSAEIISFSAEAFNISANSMEHALEQLQRTFMISNRKNGDVIVLHGDAIDGVVVNGRIVKS
jgi:hypothetical protein